VAYKPEQFFEAVIELARHVLRDLEPDQVPASMRRVVAYSGGSLPPPFARSLLRELDQNPFLRDKVMERWTNRDGSLPDTPSGWFVGRPESWLEALLEAVHVDGSRVGESSLKADAIARDALDSQVVALKERIKSLRSELEAERNEAREALRLARQPGRTDRMAESDLRAEMTRLAAELESTRDSAREREAELTAKLKEAQERSREHRRQRAAIAANSVADPFVVTGGDELARVLDRLASMVGVPVAPGATEAGSPSDLPVLVYSATIRPDSAEAIDWLMEQDSVTLLVDGYNLGFLLASGRLDPPRARLLAREVSGRVVARSSATVTIVYDSEIEDAPQTVGSGQITEMYSGGRSADDVIVDLAEQAHRVVVVSNDRDVRHRCERYGAIGLWSDALAEWSRRR
jgi:hypothetical protein